MSHLKIVSTFVALAAFGASALAQATPPTATKPEADPVVISANGLSIRKSEFEGALQSLPAEYQQYAAKEGKRQFAEDFLRMKLLAQQGTKAGLDRSPSVLAQLALMKENLIASEHLRKIEQAIALPDAELKAAYDASRSKYEAVKARHILIAFKGSPAAREGRPDLSEAAAKTKAEDLRKRIVGGADFAALARTESDDVGSGVNGGDLGEFGRGQMVPEFEQAAFATKNGDVAPVVRTQFGYHVVQVQDRTTAAFETVKGDLEKSLRQEKLQVHLDAMKAAAQAKFDDAYFPAAAPAPAAGKK
jgi:peptidyl-prolyl cis-trans isomerase C